MATPFATSLPLLGIDPDNREMLVRVRIDAPRQVHADQWSCTVSLPGWEDDPREISNVDGLGAVMLAIQFAQARMKSFEDRGGQWFDPKSREAWPIADYFSTLTAV